MTDARFPERWLMDGRLQSVSPAEYRQHVNTLAWSVSNRTDGHVPRSALALIPHAAERDARGLAKSGLWREVPDGWMIEDFEDTQTSRADLTILANARRRERDKKRRQRAHKAGDHSLCEQGCHQDSHVTSPVTVPVTVPGDVLPDSTRPGQDRTGQASTGDEYETPAEMRDWPVEDPPDDGWGGL